MIAGLLTTLVAKVSALGMAGKAALALTTASAVAGGAAATDLPDAVAAALERDRGAEEASVPAGPDEAEFGRGIADDASDPESPGVDGPDVADEARLRAQERGEESTGEFGEAVGDESDAEGTGGPPEENPANDAAADGLERARENTDGTPAKVPESVGPDTAEDRRAPDGPEAADSGSRVGPPPETPAGPPEETPADDSAEDTPAGPPEETPPSDSGQGNGRSQGAPGGQ